jgi:putative Ig domain-containing protein
MRDVGYLKRAQRYCGVRNPISHFLVLPLLLSLAWLAASCGSAAQGSNSSNPSTASLALTPDSATVASLQQLQFTARVSGSANTAVSWSASAGSISSSGVFTAPKVTSNTPVVITATSGTDSALAKDATVAIGGSRASATVTITPVTPSDSLAIASSALPQADAGAPYEASLTATGGVAPYQWSVASGSLPSGIQLRNSSGVITGMTALPGSYPLTAKVTDTAGHSATAAFTLAVASSSSSSPAPVSGFDGPAELPRIYIKSAMSNTPSPGSTITVGSGGDLQSALNNANCGDTIQLQAGATFTGAFMFPAKSCDDDHWIIVRTSADDSSLPAEGSRLTPCYAGVSSLPGRPAFNCASTNNVLARLVLPASGNGPVIFASGASHYRLTGLEITRTAGTGLVYALSSVVNGGTANNLILDRVWMHGTAQDETTRGVWLEGTTYVSIVDSFLTDFHCISASGACGDSQAIAGGIGSDPMGPYKIMNNFLEASGENILFGGGNATGTPADIQVAGNHMFKPLAWMKGQPGFVGGKNGNAFLVKNLFELKNVKRIVLDGNIMENSWGGFSQVGFAILITPKNQAGNNGNNLCPICQVTDVTVRNGSIRHVGAGLQIANAFSDNGAVPLDGQRYSIHDIVIDDIDGGKYDGPGEFAQLSVSPGAPLLQNVTINHVTAFPSQTLFIIGDMVSTTSRMKNVVFTNSIVNAGGFSVWSTGGGPENCAYRDNPLITFNACFANSAFAANAIIAPPAEGSWPEKNFFPSSAATVEFVDYNSGNGGDYRLQASSPYKGKATDGKDLGADIDVINFATAGVE